MKTIIRTEQAPQAIGPYSQAVRSGGFLFVSGQLPLDPATGAMTADIRAQTRQALENARQILEAAGSGMDKVVKTTVLLSDMANFVPMNEVYAEFFPAGGYPARAAFQAARLPKDALVEIEMIAEA